MEDLICASTDTFTFQGNAGDAVVIHVVELSDYGGVCGGIACFCFDQRIELLDSANTLLAVNVSPNGNNTQNRFRTKIGPETLPGSGIYKVTVRDKQNNGRGEYTIFLQRMNAPGRADSISSGQNLLVNLNPGEVDTYEFEACPPARIIIDMTPDAIGNVDPVLELYNQQGQALAFPDSGHIEYVFTSGSTFTLLAFSRKDESGTYRLNLTVEIPSNNPPENPQGFPQRFLLGENYPNPFNPVTRIRFELPKATKVDLSVYNILGQKVETLVDEYRPAGVHEVIFDATGMSAGIYEYVMEADGFTATRRMILLK